MSILKQTLLKNMSVEEAIQVPAKRLIVAIRENPALYDKTHAQYNNKKLKATLWNKIAEEKVFPSQWPSWSKTEKTNAVCFMQKRWNNLRTSFAREVKKTIKRKQEGLEYDSLVSWKYYRPMLFMKNFMTIILNGTPLIFEKDESESNIQDCQTEESPVKNEENEDFELFEVQYLEDNSNDSEDSSSQNVSAPEFIKVNNEDEIIDTDTEDEVTTPIKKAKKNHEGSLKRKASSSNNTSELLKLLENNDNNQNDTDTEIEVTPKKKISKGESIHRSPVNNSNLSVHNRDNYKKNKTSESRQSILPILSQDANKLDQDIYFAMSLVPLLKELSPSQKLQAKIDILTLFKKYKKDDD